MRSSVLPLLFAILLALPGLASAASIVRGPFLQQTGPDRALVVLRTDVPAAVALTRPDGATVATSAGTTEHVLALEGLAPASEVTYGVTVDGAPASGPHTFRTPGLPGSAAGRRAVLGVIGDMGTGGPFERAHVALMHEAGVEAILSVGDNAYPDGAVGDWDPKFFGPFAPLLPEATFWPAPGDHEYLSPGAAPYLDAFVVPAEPAGERYYSYDWGDVHVASIDTNCISPIEPAEAGCDPEEMTAWLREDLARSRAAWKLVHFHRPVEATGKYGPDAKVQAALRPILEETGVDLVLQGHNHSYERTWPMRGGALVRRDYVDPGAPVYVTSGGGGEWIYEQSFAQPDWSAMRASESQHLRLTVDGGTLRVESIRPDGTRLDEFTLRKTLPPPSGAAAPFRRMSTPPGGAWRPSGS